MSYFSNNSNLFSIQSAVEEFNQVITQQNALIATLAARITANEATLGNLSTVTNNSGSAIGVLQSAFTTNTADITTNASAISVLQGALATNTAAIVVLQAVYTSIPVQLPT